jgi:hypothetical protein
MYSVFPMTPEAKKADEEESEAEIESDSELPPDTSGE